MGRLGRREHELKIWPQYFRDIIAERKQFELRRDDRGFQVGDILVLREYEPERDQFTGREADVEVISILRPETSAVARGLLQPGAVLMGIRLLEVWPRQTAAKRVGARI